ncbi:MAG: hypothetical protein AAE987_03540 [Thermoplasmataceae archaeon]|jgi:hypothetical protein
MWSTEVLDNFAIIRLKNRFPKSLNLPSFSFNLENKFFFSILKDGQLYMYRNLGKNLSEIESFNLKRTKEFQDYEMNIIQNSVLQISVKSDVFAFFNHLNSLKGCRVNPNVLSNSQDAYIQTDFSDEAKDQVSNLLLDLMSSNIKMVEIIAFGKHSGGIPYLLKLFTDFGGELSDLFLIKTEWHLDTVSREKENSGVFLNEGKFVPKYFTNTNKDILIFKLEIPDYKESPSLKVFSQGTNIVEMEANTTFFSDFYKEVIETYYGTIFFEAEIYDNVMTSYFIVDENLSTTFLSGLQRHWSIPKRKDHHNLLVAAMNLTNFKVPQDQY